MSEFLSDLSLFSPAALLPAVFLVAAAVLARHGLRVDGALRQRWQAVRGRLAMRLPVSATEPRPADVTELQEIVLQLFGQKRWQTLGEVLDLLTRRPTDATDGRRLYDVAVDAALAPVGQARGILELQDAVGRFAEAGRNGHPVLVALHCRALSAALRRAERIGGPAAMGAASNWASEIEAIVGRFRAGAAVTVPCLAEAVYHAGAFQRRGDLVALCQAFRSWQEADPGNSRPYIHHARRLGALGPPARAELSRHLSETVAARRYFGGPGTLLRTRLSAAGQRPLSSLPGHCGQSLLCALGEVCDGPGGQWIVNAMAAKALEDGDEALARGIVACHLRRVIGECWSDAEAFHALYWRATSGRAARRAMEDAGEASAMRGPGQPA